MKSVRVKPGDAIKDARAEAKSVEADRHAKAIMQGYTGDACSECSNFTMVRMARV